MDCKKIECLDESQNSFILRIVIFMAPPPNIHRLFFAAAVATAATAVFVVVNTLLTKVYRHILLMSIVKCRRSH